RFALPRAGWWHRKAQRFRLPIRPLSHSHIKHEAHLKRQAWIRYRRWSRVTSGVLLSVLGAVHYGTSQVCYKIVPHFDTEGFRQYIHQIMALFGHTGKEVVMVVDRSGIHRADKLASTLGHWHERFRLYFASTMWTSPQSYRRFLARAEGAHQRWTMFSHSVYLY